MSSVDGGARDMSTVDDWLLVIVLLVSFNKLLTKKSTRFHLYEK